MISGGAIFVAQENWPQTSKEREENGTTDFMRGVELGMFQRVYGFENHRLITICAFPCQNMAFFSYIV